ncbi:MAG: Type 1 glutamine amidotransferase-like domain-containing protein [Lapillicoccus sp.]
MPADAPTILATSGGRIPGRRTQWVAGPLTAYAVELARVSVRRPRVCFLATALGDSAAVLLAMWRLHGLDTVMREVWEAGVVLTGVSAGSICWHVGGPTDSFGPELRPITNGLGLLPYANGVHYDSEEQRRPLLHRLVAAGALPMAYATDDGVGLHYRGTELVEALTELPGKGAYRVERGPDGQAVETRIEPGLLTP